MDPLKALKNIRGRMGFRYFLCATGIFVSAGAIIADHLIIREKEDEVRAKKAEAVSFHKALGRYMAVLNEVSPLRERSRVQVSGSIGSVLEEVCKGAGAEKNISSIKEVEGKRDSLFPGSGAVVSLEGISLNQMLNIVYRIERHKNLLLIREFSIRSSYDSPGMFDVRVEVGVLSGPAGG